MALSEDQRAMLQLLLEGGQNYADIGALLGVEAGEVRSRARRALREIGGADPDSQVGLTDYLLGQADPIGRADVARALQSDPGAAALASSLATQLRLIAPKGRLPDLPGQPARVPQPAEPPPGVPGGTPQGPAAARARAAGGVRGFSSRVGTAFRSLGERERRLPVVLAAAALLVVAVVLVVVNPFGGDDSDDEGGSTSGDNPEVITLEPPDGGSAGGQLTIANVVDRPVLQVNLFGLEPSDKQVYFIWLYNSDDEAVPVSQPAQADADGNLTGQTQLAPQLQQSLPAFSSFVVTRATVENAGRALTKAQKDKNPLGAFVGEIVLQGEIPRDLEGSTPTTPTATTPSTPAPTPTTPTTTAP